MVADPSAEFDASEGVYTTREVARLYGVQSLETVMRWAREGRLPAVRVMDRGGSWRFSRKWVDDDLRGRGAAA